MSKVRMLVTALAFLLIAGMAFAQQEQNPQRQREQQAGQQQAGQAQAEKNIIDTLKQEGNFSKFLELVKTAKLEDTLKEKGPLTVFAPTDSAFEQASEDEISKLKQNDAQLKTFIQRHVSRGEMTAAELANQQQVNPIEGAAVPIRAGGQELGQALRERETPARERSRQGQLPAGIQPDDEIQVTLIPKADPTNVKTVKMEAQKFREAAADKLVDRLAQAKASRVEQLGVREGKSIVMIGRARIVEPDIRASNGIIQGINRPLTQENTQPLQARETGQPGREPQPGQPNQPPQR